MLFGVHNHYNNNSDSIGSFLYPKSGFPLMGELSVRMTDQGLTIFNLDKQLELEKKLKIASALNTAILKEFGTGLSFATCGSSDCMVESELVPYYKGIKEIAPSATTIFVDAKFICGDWPASTQNLPVDHLVDQWADKPTAEQIIELLRPSEADRAIPAEGWETFEKRLEKIFEIAKQSVLAEKPANSGFSSRNFKLEPK